MRSSANAPILLDRATSLLLGNRYDAVVWTVAYGSVMGEIWRDLSYVFQLGRHFVSVALTNS
jgi:hypothetical protein